jgi:hypothetical protein
MSAARGRSRTLEETRAVPVDRLPGTPCALAGATVMVGKLSVDQWLAVAGLAVKWAASRDPAERERFQQMREAMQGGEQMAGGGLGSVLGTLLTKDMVLSFYSILVDRREAWLEQNFDLAELAEVLDAADEHNDLRRIFAAFSRVAGRWRSQSEGSSQRSSASPPEATTNGSSAPTAPSTSRP